MGRRQSGWSQKKQGDRHKAQSEWPHDAPPLASSTKHLTTLRYPLPFLRKYATLCQNDTSGSTGSSLWLSAQVMACYMQATADTYFASVPKARLASGQPRPKALELGAGVGLNSVLLAAFGWDAFATDIEPSFSQVLNPTIESNRSLFEGEGDTGTVNALPLDWCASDDVISSLVGRGNHGKETVQPIDFILTTDTLYAGDLVHPLLHTIKRLVTPGHTRVLLALERRDPVFVERAFDCARSIFGFSLHAVSQCELRQATEQFGNAQWDWEELEDIEVWQLSIDQQ
ncbi:hypothetical protein K437DRAFT_178434 [Tilletiaria anomala UBC 951]|uniref:Uncharacterized protein n=1 Tax=Tilletiaria anomala (strain ATCC 24038 / CBS 436.72 / UBC 951) TaxID=1037660 RepID=A0A066VM63_TILAU|nr:uncharacterized protein K437DRAFT_178434 [Tilletiaria anomala UBC 951]KDN41338.1 hypothetical protein K437DRAFT_178434 [Tilletiaria anomala UBC 951]